jgi:hypothetical protein
VSAAITNEIPVVMEKHIHPSRFAASTSATMQVLLTLARVTAESVSNARQVIEALTDEEFEQAVDTLFDTQPVVVHFLS